MKIVKRLIFCVLITGLINISYAGQPIHFKEIQTAIVGAVDAKKRLIVLRNMHYKLRIGATVRLGNKRSNIYALKTDQDVSFKTRINKRTKEVEVSEIWIIPE